MSGAGRRSRRFTDAICAIGVLTRSVDATSFVKACLDKPKCSPVGEWATDFWSELFNGCIPSQRKESASASCESHKGDARESIDLLLSFPEKYEGYDWVLSDIFNPSNDVVLEEVKDFLSPEHSFCERQAFIQKFTCGSRLVQSFQESQYKMNAAEFLQFALFNSWNDQDETKLIGGEIDATLFRKICLNDEIKARVNEDPVRFEKLALLLTVVGEFPPDNLVALLLSRDDSLEQFVSTSTPCRDRQVVIGAYTDEFEYALSEIEILRKMSNDNQCFSRGSSDAFRDSVQTKVGANLLGLWRKCDETSYRGNHNGAAAAEESVHQLLPLCKGKDLHLRIGLNRISVFTLAQLEDLGAVEGIVRSVYTPSEVQKIMSILYLRWRGITFPEWNAHLPPVSDDRSGDLDFLQWAVDNYFVEHGISPHGQATQSQFIHPSDIHTPLGEELVDQPRASTGEELVDQPRASTGEDLVDQPRASTGEELVDMPRASTGEELVDMPRASTGEELVDMPRASTGEELVDQPRASTGFQGVAVEEVPGESLPWVANTHLRGIENAATEITSEFQDEEAPNRGQDSFTMPVPAHPPQPEIPMESPTGDSEDDDLNESGNWDSVRDIDDYPIIRSEGASNGVVVPRGRWLNPVPKSSGAHKLELPIGSLMRPMGKITRHGGNSAESVADIDDEPIGGKVKSSDHRQGHAPPGGHKVVFPDVIRNVWRPNSSPSGSSKTSSTTTNNSGPNSEEIREAHQVPMRLAPSASNPQHQESYGVKDWVYKGRSALSWMM